MVGNAKDVLGFIVEVYVHTDLRVYNIELSISANCSVLLSPTVVVRFVEYYVLMEYRCAFDWSLQSVGQTGSITLYFKANSKADKNIFFIYHPNQYFEQCDKFKVKDNGPSYFYSNSSMNKTHLMTVNVKQSASWNTESDDYCTELNERKIKKK